MGSDCRFRMAATTDVTVLVQHRRWMYEDMRRSQGFQCSDNDLDTMQYDYENYLAATIANGSVQACVAEVDGGIVASGCGTILSWLPGPGFSSLAVGLLHSMYTAPEHRKQGIGRGIIDALAADCRSRGCRQFIIGGRGTNAERHLYETIGFRPSENMRLIL